MTGTFHLVDSDSPNRQTTKKILCVCFILIFLFVVTCCALIAVLALKANCPEESEPSPSVPNTTAKRDLRSSVKFVMMSDVHLDSYYDDSVDKKTLCRRLGSYGTPSFKAPYGRIGCDAPPLLVDSIVQNAASTAKDASFVIIPGDLSARNLNKPYFINETSTPQQRILTNIFEVTNRTKKAFPNIPIFPMFGNNDLPDNFILPVNNSWYSDTLPSFASLILCEGCKGIGSSPTTMEELRKTFMDGGYYSVMLPNTKNRMKLLVLNTMYWSFNAVQKPQGPHFHDIARRQMAWMEEHLKQAKNNGQKVLLTSHISPGIDPYNGQPLWANNYTELYVSLVAGKYKHVVAGQIYGHTHYDDFHVQTIEAPNASPDSQSPLNKSFVLFVGPVSPVFGNNPSYRVGYLDPVKQVLLDYDVHYMSLATATEYNSPTWQFGYRFSERYPSKNPFIDSERIYQLTQELIDKTSDQTWNNYVFARVGFAHPGGYTRFVLYCAVRHVLESDYKKCIQKYKVTGG